MSKYKKRLASREKPAQAGWLMFDTSQLSWIAFAACGLLVFAYMIR